MATHHAIAATSAALVRLLEAAAAQDDDWRIAGFDLRQADGLQSPIDANQPQVSLYLYRVNLSVTRHDRGLRRGPGSERFRAAVLLDLHYLVTAWSKDARTAQQLLGWAIRVLGDTPVIPPAILNAYRPSHAIFRPEEGVELGWEALSLSELMDVWQVAQARQAPSASYVVRGIAIDSDVTVDEGNLVRERHFEYAGRP